MSMCWSAAPLKTTAPRLSTKWVSSSRLMKSPPKFSVPLVPTPPCRESLLPVPRERSPATFSTLPEKGA